MVWVLALAVINSKAVEINLWPLPLYGVWPLSLVIFAFAAIGFMIGRLAGSIENLSARQESRNLRKRNRDLEKDLDTVEKSQKMQDIV